MTTDIFLGSAPNDDTGDTLRAAGTIINDNFAEVIVSMKAMFGGTYGEDKVRIGCCIPRPSRSGTTVTWSLLNDADHAPVFFTSCEAAGTVLTLNHPEVVKILTLMVCMDDHLGKFGLISGHGSGLTATTLTLTATNIVQRCILTSNGSAWSKAGDTGWVGTVTHGTSNLLTRIATVPNSGSNYYCDVPLIYAGTNNRYVRQVYGGVGNYQTNFQLIDPTDGTAKTPDSSDLVIAWNPYQTQQLSLVNAPAGSINQDIFDDASSPNLWVIAAFVVA